MSVPCVAVFTLCASIPPAEGVGGQGVQHPLPVSVSPPAMEVSIHRSAHAIQIA